jgi:hypothetical protein
VAVVPALYINEFDTTKRGDINMSFTTLINTCALETNNIAQLAVANLRNSLMIKAKMQQESVVKDNTKKIKWIQLFSYFGKTEHSQFLQNELNGISNDRSSSSSSGTLDEYTFD